MYDLQPASLELIPSLLQILKTDWFDSLAVYYTLENYYNWSKTVSNFEVKLLLPGGILDKYGTHVLYITGYRNSITLYTIDKDLECFKESLIQCPYIHWDKTILSCIHERFVPMLHQIIQHLNLKLENKDFIGRAFYITPDNGRQIQYEIPSSVDVKELEAHHAETVNSVWPHRNKTSVLYVRDLIRLNKGLGVFLKDSGTLAAWILHNDFGGPALLQTLDGHQRKGFAELLARIMTKYLAEKGIYSQVFIATNNTASEHIFQKLGYQETWEVRWIFPTI